MSGEVAAVQQSSVQQHERETEAFSCWMIESSLVHNQSLISLLQKLHYSLSSILSIVLASAVPFPLNVLSNYGFSYLTISWKALNKTENMINQLSCNAILPDVCPAYILNIVLLSVLIGRSIIKNRKWDVLDDHLFRWSTQDSCW